ncbi:hypothetical protein GCM10025777_53450 [Membranihabitans marinus]
MIFQSLGFAQQVSNGFAMPESITSDGHRFFVSSQGQDFNSRDGDGFISEIDDDGKIIYKKFLPTQGVLHAPKGMAIVGDVIFVADLFRIMGFNIDSRETVFELNIVGAELLNDICKLENGFLAVTETISGNIYKIDIQQKSYEIISNIPGANGISYNANTKQLIVCSNGSKFGDGSVYIQSENSEFRKLPNIPDSFFDGIEWMDDQHFIISDWINFPVNGKGKIWTYDLKKMESTFSFTPESIADIFYDVKTSKVYMAQMLHNRILISKYHDLDNRDKGYGNLYNYGVIDALIGGLYRGSLPIKELKLKGDFGIGAPDMIDGELIVVNGIAYQTKVNGETVELSDDHLTSFASVTFFKSDTGFIETSRTDKTAILESIENELLSKNQMYAIKISGHFDFVKTRAFPPVEKEPFPKLSDILHHQTFFNHQNTDGSLIGFLLPNYLNGINAGGFHFHYLSDDKELGGHMLDFKGENLKIEIAQLKSFELVTPNNEDFQNFDFVKKENESLRKVEQGR